MSDNDGLSDGDSEHSGDDEGCCSEDEKHRSSMRKNIPWDEIDEQRLRVWPG